MEAFLMELCWRDHSQRVWQHHDPQVELRSTQFWIKNDTQLPLEITTANTGIQAIDSALLELKDTGYMHHHLRMYLAALVCNHYGCHWRTAAKWLFSQLCDADAASNHLSWQWVCGANAPKVYYANQENINKYTHSTQLNSFLDIPYEAFEQMAIPACLLPSELIALTTELPATIPLTIDPQLPTFIYNYYNLDPLWHAQEAGNRILLLEPQFFQAYPVSPKCIDFMLSLAKNINHIQVFVGSFEELCQHYALAQIYYKEHPLNIGYRGQEEPRDWIAAAVEGYFPSFFAYWKKVEKHLKTQSYNDH
jgi:deoxyribodipyrimidine photo-lyase